MKTILTLPIILSMLSLVLSAQPTWTQNPPQTVIDKAAALSSVSELKGAALIKKQELSESYQKGLQEQQEEGEIIGFVMEGDFNRDGVQDMVIAGTYERSSSTRRQHQDSRVAVKYQVPKAKNTGSFLLIGSSDNQVFRRVKLFTFDEEFIVIKKIPNRLTVFFCLGCDHGGFIDWDGSGYVFRPFPPAGVRTPPPPPK